MCESFQIHMDQSSDVCSFYAGKTVFLTGGSGFLGKIALEKLLRTTDVKKIYLLLRTKKDKDPQKRLDELFSGPCFVQLEKIQPNYKSRVELIAGDLKQSNLGMNEQDAELLIKEVEVILHFAATVRFDENLKFATAINVRAVRDLLKLAKKIPQLKSFLHVSTAFAHCVRKDIDEVIYDTPLSGEQLISVMDNLDEKLVEEITPKFLGDFPNTYVYTKAIAENMVRSEAKGLPISILRPSVVVSSYKEPQPGWIDSYYGVTGLCVAIAMGAVRVICCKESNRSEVVPADYVSNAALVAAWESSMRGTREEDEVPVFNYVSSPTNPITWPKFIASAYTHGMTMPSPLVIWHYMLFTTSNEILYRILFFLLHMIPAYIIDFVRILIAKKPLAVKLYKKIGRLMEVTRYFALRQWDFTDTNVSNLWKGLSKTDKERFPFDMANLDWDSYIHVYVGGCREFLLKDTLDTIPAGRKKLFRLKVLHYILCGVLLCGFAQILYLIYNAVF